MKIKKNSTEATATAVALVKAHAHNFINETRIHLLFDYMNLYLMYGVVVHFTAKLFYR